MSNHSRAQIVGTIGRSTQSINSLRILIESGMDAVRLDLKEGSLEEHRQAIACIRMAAAEHQRYIPIVGDLPGPSAELRKESKYDTHALSIFTDLDREFTHFCIEQGIDYIGLPYVGSATDIEDVHRFLWEQNNQIRVLARVERVEALRNIEDILKVADGLVIDRKELSQKIPLEQVPYVQQNLIRKANWHHTPVITATDMLHSMIEKPLPTRAEVSDIAYAIMNGTDGILLDEETAKGNYPIEAVQMMERIIIEAERHMEERDVHLL